MSRGCKLRCAVVAEWNEVMFRFGVENVSDARNIVLVGSLDEGREFDASFAKLLWPFVCLGVDYFYDVVV